MRGAVKDICTAACESCSGAAAALPRVYGDKLFSPVDTDLLHLQALQPLVALTIRSLEVKRERSVYVDYVNSVPGS
jgi:hypothetical protein